jgi:hypothetical protein
MGLKGIMIVSTAGTALEAIGEDEIGRSICCSGDFLIVRFIQLFAFACRTQTQVK